MCELIPSFRDLATIKSWFGIARYVYNYGLNVLETQHRIISVSDIELAPLAKTVGDNNFIQRIVSTPASVKLSVFNDLKELSATKPDRVEYWTRKKANATIQVQANYASGASSNSIRILGLNDLVIIKTTSHFPNLKTGETIRIMLFKDKIYYINPKVSYLGNLARYTEGQFWNSGIDSLSRGLWLPVKDQSAQSTNTVSGDFDFSSPSPDSMWLEVQKWVPIKADLNPINLVTKTIRIAAVDPGLNPFIMIWTPNECFQIGKNANKIIKEWYQKLEVYNHMVKVEKSPVLKKYYQTKSKLLTDQIRDRVQINLNSIAIWMVKRYDIIIFPDYQDFAFGSDTFTHANFKKILMKHAIQHNTFIYLCDEAFTSKTCTNCGFANEQLKRAKIFNCPNCKIVYDRDIGAARNIFLKHIEQISRFFVY